MDKYLFDLTQKCHFEIQNTFFFLNKKQNEIAQYFDLVDQTFKNVCNNLREYCRYTESCAS